MKKEFTAIAIASTLGISGLLTIGGNLINLETLFKNESTTIVYPEEPDPYKIDDEKYQNGIEKMNDGDYQEAINYFISISLDYPEIENVQSNLLSAMVSYTDSTNRIVDELVNSPNVESQEYTNAINVINTGLNYLNSLNEKNISLSKELNKQYLYIKTLIKIYEFRKSDEPFEALKYIDQAKTNYLDKPFLIDLRESVKEECKLKISKIIDEFNSKEDYNSTIHYINNLSKEFYNDFLERKTDAERHFLDIITNKIDIYITNNDYDSAKRCVEDAYDYLKGYDDFINLYEQWHNYSDTKLVYKTITDNSYIEFDKASDIDGYTYNEVVIISKYYDEASIEFSLNKNYSTLTGTLFLTDYNYNKDEELNPLTVLITDDNGNVFSQYDDLSYKNPIKFCTDIHNTKYLKFIIIGKTDNIKIGIRNGILS